MATPIVLVCQKSEFEAPSNLNHELLVGTRLRMSVCLLDYKVKVLLTAEDLLKKHKEIHS